MVNDPEEKVNQINNPEYAGRIREMAARVKKYIEDGRSTPGAKAANDGGNSWKQITDIMSGLYAGNREGRNCVEGCRNRRPAPIKRPPYSGIECGGFQLAATSWRGTCSKILTSRLTPCYC